MRIKATELAVGQIISTFERKNKNEECLIISLTRTVQGSISASGINLNGTVEDFLFFKEATVEVISDVALLQRLIYQKEKLETKKTRLFETYKSRLDKDKAILSFLCERRVIRLTNEIAIATGMTINQVNRILNCLHREGRISKKAIPNSRQCGWLLNRKELT